MSENKPIKPFKKYFNWHAWILDVNKNIIIEPTPITIEDYWGVLTKEQTVSFIKDRIELISSLNLQNDKFKIDNNMLLNLI